LYFEPSSKSIHTPSTTLNDTLQADPKRTKKQDTMESTVNSIDDTKYGVPVEYDSAGLKVVTYRAEPFSHCTYGPSNDGTAVKPSLINQGDRAIPYRNCSIALSYNEDSREIKAVADWDEMTQGSAHWERKHCSSLKRDGTDAFFMQGPHNSGKRQVVVTCDVTEGEGGTKHGGLTFISEPFIFPFKNKDSEKTAITPSVVATEEDEQEGQEGSVWDVGSVYD
jgi:hypothetical protein